MSYWDEMEKNYGKFDFKELDRQFHSIAKSHGTVSLCLGARQPRWPENHWPGWAMKLSKTERAEALLLFISKVVNRYKDNSNIVSYQLENEALLKSFGLNPEIDRNRLRREFALVKKLDPSKPVIMTASTSWGIPLRKPIPDIVGFSYYQTVFNSQKKRYTTAYHRPWLHRSRAKLIKYIWHRQSFNHELQLEPWGPKEIWEMKFDEQMKSMSQDQFTKNTHFAKQTGLSPIDLWGGEWWYWSELHGHPDIARTVLASLR